MTGERAELEKKVTSLCGGEYGYFYQSDYQKTMAAADAYAAAERLACLDEILDGEYTLEQIADLRLNIVDRAPIKEQPGS